MTTPKPVIRLTTPADVVASIPSIIGYPPQHSLVALVLGERRMLVALRVDLPETAELADQWRRTLTANLQAPLASLSAADRIVLVVFSDDQAVAAAAGPAAIGAAESLGLRVGDALEVRDGRWRSYLCEQSCCPPEGTPVRPSPVIEQLAAAQAVHGRGVLSSRAEQVAFVAAPDDRPAAFTRQVSARGRRTAAEDAGTDLYQQDLGRLADALTTVPGPDALADLAVALHDAKFRDAAVVAGMRQPGQAVALFGAMARNATGKTAAHAAATLGWVAYLAGDGSLANIALDRAFAEGATRAASLLRQGIDQGLPPRAVRAQVESLSL